MLLRALSIDEKITPSKVQDVIRVLVEQGYTEDRANTLVAPDGTKIRVLPSAIFAPEKVWHIVDCDDGNRHIHVCFTGKKLRWMQQHRGRGPSLNLVWLTEYPDEANCTTSCPLYLEDMLL